MQAEAIVARLRSSDNPAWREAGEYEHAADVVSGLAWQFFKKDWSDVRAALLLCCAPAVLPAAAALRCLLHFVLHCLLRAVQHCVLLQLSA